MTRKLEELFDLPNSAPEITEESVPSESPVISPETLHSIDKIEAALPLVRGLEASDTEMDDLATRAVESYDNLMDLGMNVDSRYASEILAVASQMLGHAITAKTAKMNKKLKMIDLQLKKMGLDRRHADTAMPTTATGHVLDRNELLQRLTGKTVEKE
jgi:hypothetical protein